MEGGKTVVRMHCMREESLHKELHPNIFVVYCFASNNGYQILRTQNSIIQIIQI